MCGIAGFIRRAGVADQRVVTSQLSRLRHRGPDAEGVFALGRAAVGQTRLSIIDLDTGDPPIATPDGRCGVALNGEIYNYRELRRDLEGRGARFRTTGDTEVIAHLAQLEDDPVAIARSLDGMFAFAVWDAGRDRLLLGRDRFGKKPLHYWVGPESVVFASEIKALLQHPGVPRRVDQSVVPAYLRLGYVPTPRTFFEGVLSVPPGHVLTVFPDQSISIEEYWRPPLVGIDTSRLDVGFEAAAREVRGGLERAVAKRLVSDVPVGAFLSGGVDSSAVVAIMARLTGESVPTFTIGFDDADGFDERPYARLVADAFGTDHTELEVAPRAADLIERLVDAHDQPFGDSSAIPTYLLSELAGSQVKVALSGDGGDELFVGYERFLGGLAAGAWRHVPAPARRGVRTVTSLASRTPRGARLDRVVDTAGLGLPEAFRRWIAFVPEEAVRALVPWDDGWGVRDFEDVWRQSEGAATLDRLVDLTLRTYLLDDLLPKADRTSMAHALEVRSPFLDHELAATALRLSPRVRLRRGRLKAVLKEAVAGLVPEAILHRPKHGFGVPLGRWFRDDLSTLLAGTVGAPDAALRGVVEVGPLDRLLAEHRSGTADHGHALFTLLTLELFLRREAS